MKTVCIAGHFNPVHPGHLKLIEEARKLGDRLVVIVANDHQAQAKRPVVFMPLVDRIQIMSNLKGVDQAVPSVDFDTNVCETLRIIKPDVFASGCEADHPDAIAEKIVCDELGIETHYKVGGEKIQSSSLILSKYYDRR